MDDATFDRFLELHQGLPRQAPGGREHTLHALELVPDLPLRPRIVDLGCGPGAHTLDLLEAVEGATVVAVDLLPSMLDELRERARDRGLLDRLTLVEGDMARLPDAVHPASFHLVWSEGAAYNLGFDAALASWRHLLLPGGFLAVSELAWRVPDAEIPTEARAFFEEEYPGMRSDDANRAAFDAHGWELAGSFALPSEAWWAPYYAPLRERLPDFEAAHPDDEAAQAVAADTRREIEIFEQYGHAFGYFFYVARMR